MNEMKVQYFGGWLNDLVELNQAVESFVNAQREEDYVLLRHEVMMTESGRLMVIVEMEQQGLSL